MEGVGVTLKSAVGEAEPHRFFGGRDPPALFGWWPEEVGAEEVRETLLPSRRTVDTAGVRRFPCPDQAGRARTERTAEAFLMGLTREWADPGGTEEILQAGQAWGVVRAEVFCFWPTIWMDPRIMKFCVGGMVTHPVRSEKTLST